MVGKVAEGFVQVFLKAAETAEQDVGYPRSLQVFPEYLDEVQFWAVVRQPEDLHVLFSHLQVAMKGLRMVRFALVQNQDYPPSGLTGPTQQLLEQGPRPPGSAARLLVVHE